MKFCSGSRSPWTAKRYHDTTEDAAEVLWKWLGRHQKMYLLVILPSSCQVEGEKDNIHVREPLRVHDVCLDSTLWNFPLGRLMVRALDSFPVFNPSVVIALCSCARNFTLTVITLPRCMKEYRGINCWGWPCDGLASHPGGSRNTPSR